MASKRAKKGSRSSKSKWVRPVKRALIAFGIVGGLALAAGLAIYIPIQKEAADDAANIENLLSVKDSKPSAIYSADGVVLYSTASERRTVVNLKDLPKYVRYAIVAAEDRRFYDHGGVDARGLSRALMTTVVDRKSQGGSTIEMQLAKNLINGRERTFTRKLRDIATAQQISNLKSKDEILNLYANMAYFGEGAAGIESGARTYFNKSAKDLTIAEAAMLARCVRTPSRDNPIKNLETSIDQRNYVLGVMRDEHWITEPEYQAAVAEVPKINPNPLKGKVFIKKNAAHFVRHVLDEFQHLYPGVNLATGGYKIYTTLDYRLQNVAVESVRDVIKEYHKQYKVSDGAFIAMDAEGKILAEVGGVDYTKSQFNKVTQGGRQPGSGFKPIVYAVALKEGAIHMGDMLSNARIPFTSDGRPWDPSNASPKESAPSYSLRTALALSVNRPAIHTLQAVGVRTVVKYAKESFGFTSELRPFDSLALGTSDVTPLEMAEAYSVFMLRGDRVRPHPITKIEGPGGEVLKEFSPEITRNAFDPSVCEQMDGLLEAVVTSGTGTGARGVPNARGKTGTTNDYKDAWFNGYTDNLLGVAWVGNTRIVKGKERYFQMAHGAYGGTISVHIWARVMAAARAQHLKALNGKTFEEEKPAVAKDKPADLPSDAAANDPDMMPDIVPTPGPTVPDGAPASPSGDDDPTVPKATPPVKSPDDPPVKKPAADPEDTVEVEVCADTGLLASRYCPETVTRTYKRGQQPKSRCKLHQSGGG